MTDIIGNTEQHSDIKIAFLWLKKLIDYRINYELHQEKMYDVDLKLADHNHPLTKFIKSNALGIFDVVILLLSFAPFVSSTYLNNIIKSFLPDGGDFIDFGGVKGTHQRGIIPTAETVLYVLAGTDIDSRLKLANFILTESVVLKKGIVELERVPVTEPFFSGKLILVQEYAHLFLTNTELKPQMNKDFPASLITTALHWHDLVLTTKTLNEVKEIENWLSYNNVLMQDWGMKSKIKPGYRVLFYGLPGTGKTLTASLLGKHTNKDVYRVDLSMVVSKYIGETEKNLSKLFDKSIDKDWILFFDEADSIFGKRTNVRDAHDKYANQEVSYLLQRIEAHPGLIILASNYKNNIDVAFTRRFNNIIEFDLPSYEERKLLWEKNLPVNIPLEDSISIQELSKKYNITGANIVNVIQYACLKTIANKQKIIQRKYILEGIKREYTKEGKTINISI